MAFLTVEDLVGTVEVVVFPRDYEKCQMFLNEDARLLSREEYLRKTTKPAN